MLKDLIYVQETEYCPEDQCDFAIQEDYRLYDNSTAVTLIIGMLYVSPVFVCIALAILSFKTLSTLDHERRCFAVLYSLRADAKMQRAVLLRQTGAFFLTPFVLPLLMTAPLGMIFGEIYEIWDLAGLIGQRAIETAVLITLVMSNVYALYFLITYRIACGHVVYYGTEGGNRYGLGQ